MKLVREVFGNRQKTGDLGVEIEVEGVNLPLMDSYWNNEADGSLRGPESREYVLVRPRPLNEVRIALDKLDEAYKLNKTVVHETVRAGVHVHVNCQRLNMVELLNYMTLYLILENVLVKFCGEHREGNLFCLRATDAEYVVNKIVNCCKSMSFRTFNDDAIRYASMNVKALASYGSLEFRAMRGTRDLDAIYNWCKILLDLRDSAVKYDSPIEIIQDFSVLGPSAFLKKAMGANFKLLPKVENIEFALHEGMRIAQDIAYCVDWESWKKKAKVIGGVSFDENDPALEPPEDL